MIAAWQIGALGGVYLFFILLGQVFFKKASVLVKVSGGRDFALSLAQNFPLWVAVACYFAAMFSWVWMLKYVALSRLFPVMTAILLVILPLVSQHFLEETLGPRYWFGVVLILAGIGLIASEMRIFS